jgi:hypothetical protein
LGSANIWPIRISPITLLLAMVLLSFVTSFSKQKAAQPTMPKFSELSDEDRTRLEQQRAVVATAAKQRYGTSSLRKTAADLPVLQRLIDDKVFSKTQTYELQSLGIAFGDVLASEKAQHIGAVSSESDAEADLVRAQANNVGDDTVDSDACEEHGKDRESTEEDHGEALRRYGVENDAFEGLDAVDRLLAVRLFKDRPNRSQRGEWVALRAYNEGLRAHRHRERELVRNLHSRVIKLRPVVACAFGEPDLFQVSTDSDNFPLNAYWGDVEPFSDGILIGKIFPGKNFINHHYCRRVHGIFFTYESPLLQRNLQHLQVIRLNSQVDGPVHVVFAGWFWFSFQPK